MPKKQINVKFPPSLIDVLRERAYAEGVTLTDLIQRFCEQGLGLPPDNNQDAAIQSVYDRLSAQFDERISVVLDERILKALEVSQSHLEEHVSVQLENRIPVALAPLENRVEDLTVRLIQLEASIPIAPAVTEHVEAIAATVPEVELASNLSEVAIDEPITGDDVNAAGEEEGELVQVARFQDILGESPKQRKLTRTEFCEYLGVKYTNAATQAGRAGLKNSSGKTDTDGYLIRQALNKKQEHWRVVPGTGTSSRHNPAFFELVPPSHP